MQVKGPITTGLAAAFFAVLVTFCAASEDSPRAAPNESTDRGSTETVEPPTVTVLNNHEVEGILGRPVLDAADENMGRIIDVIVDHSGRVRAAVIDFGGFLGVGSRKIAVDWNILRFGSGEKPAHVVVELTQAQLKAAPEYKDGKPVVVLGTPAPVPPAEPGPASSR